MSENKESDTKTVFEDIFDVTLKSENTEQKITVSNKVNEEFVDKLESIDVTNTIDINSISDEYSINILKNTYTQLKDTPFEVLLKQIFTSNNNYDNNKY